MRFTIVHPTLVSIILLSLARLTYSQGVISCLLAMVRSIKVQSASVCIHMLFTSRRFQLGRLQVVRLDFRVSDVANNNKDVTFAAVSGLDVIHSWPML